MDSMPITKDEINEVDPIDEEEIGTLEGSPTSFRLGGPMEELSRNNQPFDKPTSEEDSVVHSPHTKTKT